MPAPILVAVDFSPASERALAAAAAFARDLGVGVVLAHALGDAPDPAWEGSRGGGLGVPAKAQRVDEARRLTTEWADRLRREGLEVEPVVRDGAPDRVIVEEAERRGCAMAVVGTAGRGGLGRWLLGSVAQGVLRRAKLPVLVVPVRMGRKAPPAAPSRCVLVAVDFSAESEAAFEAGLRLAKDLRCGLRLVTVVEIPLTSASAPYSEAVFTPAMLEADEASAAAQLALLASRARALDVGAVPSVEVGHPASCILAAARDAGAACIVLGTHGRSGLRRFLLGSVAQAVAQMADRPVLVVPNRLAGEAGEWVR